MTTNTSRLRRALTLTCGLAALAALATTNAYADVSAPSEGVIEERQSYALRLITQIYNGNEDLSHTQLLGVGRVRIGNRSLTQFDYGDGAVVIQQDGGELAASRFMNNSKIEKLVVYNYDDQTMQGDAEIATLHNRIVRPWLDKGPALGENARWSQAMPLSALGLTAFSGGDIRIELGREYFTHDGIAMVLVDYAIPAFSYQDDTNRTVVQWGRGISLTDPGFGMIYLNSALHRAVARKNGNAAAPYRYSRTMVAANPDGSAMLDYRTVPQLQKHIEALFGKEAMRVIPVDADVDRPDERPLELGRRIDLLALSIGENGANEVPATAAAQGAAERGSEIGNSDNAQLLADVGLGNAVVGTAYTWADVLAGSPEEKAIFATIRNNMADWQAKSQALEIQLNGAVGEVKALERAGALETKWALKPKFLTAEQGLANAEVNFARAEKQYMDILAKKPGSGAGQMPYDEWLAAFDRITENYSAARTEVFQRISNLESIVSNPNNYDSFPRNPGLFKQYQDAASAVEELRPKVAQNATEGLQTVAQVKSIPPTRFQSFKNAVGGGLTVLGNAMNGYVIGASLANFQNQVGQDLGTGQGPALTRTYGSSMSSGETGFTLSGLGDWGLGLDLLGLAGAAVSGDVVTTVSTATAIATSSITDIVLAAKGYRDAAIKEREARIAMYQTEIRALDRKLDQAEAMMEQMDTDLAEIRSELPSLDEELDQAVKERQERSRQALEERQRAREQAQREREERERLAREEAEARKARNDRIANANDILNEDMKPDYPTAPPRNPSPSSTESSGEYDGPPPTILTQAEVASIEREQRRQKAQEELNAYQEKKLADRKADEAARAEKPGTYEYRTSSLETSELLTSAFGMEPVTMDPVTSESVEFDKDQDLFDENGNLKKVGPDDFEIPPYDPPEASTFPPTDPDDLDGYPGTGEYPAYEYESMSGTEPDLDRWAEWLETQDRRLLEQLAIGAGYPSLAFALADAENIIRKSLDDGYRAYANRGPNCAGYTGCTGSVGPWKLAWATIRLGDILAQSRGTFSTGGFSDIGISGSNLSYNLRDFGIQDGDLIDVEITQFGRPVATVRTHFLLTAGTPFSVNLRRGVASMVVTALNEGSASPNTAEVTVSNVVRGDAVQNYSLNTGQTATLRIEANAQ